jgi:hypothetical protein
LGKEVPGAKSPVVQQHGLNNISYEVSTPLFKQMCLSQLYFILAQNCLAISILQNTIRFLDETCLSEHAVKSMNSNQMNNWINDWIKSHNLM